MQFDFQNLQEALNGNLKCIVDNIRANEKLRYGAMHCLRFD